MPHLTNELFGIVIFASLAIHLHFIAIIEWRRQKLREAEAKAEARRKKFLELRDWRSVEAERLYYKAKYRMDEPAEAEEKNAI